MDLHADFLVNEFLRTYRSTFTIKDMTRLLSESGVKIPQKEIESTVLSSPLVFNLQGDLFITRTGAFTNELFSIKPTAVEYEKGVLIPGHRLIPFVDQEMVSATMDFFINNQSIPKKVAEFDTDFAMDFFTLYGEEYSPQYIASDPACKEMDLASRDFELPSKLFLTGLDLDFLKKNHGLEKNDRLLCCVSDWDMGVINLMVMKNEGNAFEPGAAGEKRIRWYKKLEKYFLESFERLGPCSTIEEQVANVFFEHRKELCVSSCGSIDEFIRRYAKKICFEFFGVETRLWKKGENVPAVGGWNSTDGATDIVVEHSRPRIRKEYMIPEVILGQYIKDMLFRRNDTFENVIKRMIPEGYTMSKAEEQALLLKVTEKHGILQKNYNWFSDQAAGPVRQGVLALYVRVAYLMYRIDDLDGTLHLFPQQELVILSQLYNHLIRILQAISVGSYSDSDYETLAASLEGMKWNFEDIEGTLESAVREQNRNRFKVIKKNL